MKWVGEKSFFVASWKQESRAIETGHLYFFHLVFVRHRFGSRKVTFLTIMELSFLSQANEMRFDPIKINSQSWYFFEE